MSIEERRKKSKEAYEKYERYKKRLWRRKGKPFRLFGKTPEWALYVIAAVILLGAAGLYMWQTRDRTPGPTVSPPGVDLQKVDEVGSGSEWFVEGSIHNGSSKTYKQASFGIAYTDPANDIVSQVVVQAENLGPGQDHPFRVRIPEYSRGLKRNVLPAFYRE